MRNARDQSDDAVFRDCQRIVRDLCERFGWALLREDDLARLVLSSIQSEVPPAQVERQAKYYYSTALYEACRQTNDPARREQGYHELHRMLHRTAYNRWPELAEDATQRALLLVSEQIDRCRNPGTFVAFALNKLRHAFQQEQRARDQDLPLEELGPDSTEWDQGTAASYLVRQEGSYKLLEAIQRLPNRQMQLAILFKYYGEWNDAEIGERLGITPGNVRVLRSRGIARLRRDKHLKDYFKEECDEEH